jgi:hypothetical protein
MIAFRAPRSFAVASLLALGSLLAACSGASESEVSSNDALSTQPGDACDASDCGPQPMLAIRCDDGSTATPVCRRNAKDTCGWDFATCPPPPVPPGPPTPPPPTPSCDKTACGPEPLHASQICADGSSTGPFCELNPKTNACGWVFTTCPPPPPPPVKCGPDQCGPEPYGVPNYLCKDGSIAGPVCEENAKGTCGWTIVSCP